MDISKTIFDLKQQNDELRFQQYYFQQEISQMHLRMQLMEENNQNNLRIMKNMQDNFDFHLKMEKQQNERLLSLLKSSKEHYKLMETKLNIQITTLQSQLNLDKVTETFKKTGKKENKVLQAYREDNDRLREIIADTTSEFLTFRDRLLENAKLRDQLKLMNMHFMDLQKSIDTLKMSIKSSSSTSSSASR